MKGKGQEKKMTCIDGVRKMMESKGLNWSVAKPKHRNERLAFILHVSPVISRRSHR